MSETNQKNKLSPKPFIIGLVVIIFTSYYFYNQAKANKILDKIEANGILEATEIQISSEVVGLVENFPFEEGDKINKEQVLATINSDIYKAQLNQAKANLLANKARYKSLKVGAKKEEIEQADLLKKQSEQVLSGSNKTYIDSKELYENRSLTKQQLDNADTQYKTSKNQYETSKANLEQLKSSFKISKTNLDRSKDLYQKQSISQQQLDTAQNQFDIVSAQLKIAEQTLHQTKTLMQGYEINLKNMKAIYENRAQQKLQLHNAEVQKEIAESNVEISKKKLDLVKSIAKKEDLDTLDAGVFQAEEGVKLAKLQLEKTKIKSKVEGILLIKSVEQGELVGQGSSIATLADLSKIWLRVYIPENQINLIKLGQDVEIKTDSFKDKVFKGKIIQISSKAEFTPKNVQTKEERVNQVFGVKILVPNPNLTLKAGVPADVEIKLNQTKTL
ncbi:MAG: efflux RND transporter periplasmic adaptor subunit [Candidatus Sericytochromatia bacterium]